jgi:hypothetical protein
MKSNEVIWYLKGLSHFSLGSLGFIYAMTEENDCGVMLKLVNLEMPQCSLYQCDTNLDVV